MSSRQFKIGVVVSSPSKQLCGQYDKLDKLDGYEFHLLYRNSVQGNPAWTPSFPASGNYEILPSPKIKLPGRAGTFFTADPRAALKKHDFDAVIVHGIYDTSTVWQTIAWCKKNNKPYLLRCDANVSHETSFKKKYLMGPFIYRNIRGASALLYIGDRNKKYYKYYGAKEEQLFKAPWEIDYDDLNEFHQKAVCDRADIRVRFGFEHDEHVIVTVGRLIKRKGYDLLINALARLHAQGVNVRLAIVGEGPYRSVMEQRIRDANCPAVLLGNMNRKGVVDCLTASEIFALASSYEPWGLVVNEAAMCGLPLILSSVTGAVPELLKEGINGFTFDCKSEIDFYEIVKKMIKQDMSQAMGQCSREIICKWRTENSAINGYKEALDKIFD